MASDDTGYLSPSIGQARQDFLQGLKDVAARVEMGLSCNSRMQFMVRLPGEVPSFGIVTVEMPQELLAQEVSDAG